jgi:ParB family chromosome partitioning protein
LPIYRKKPQKAPSNNMSNTNPTIEILPTAGLVPYARNSRTHSPEQVAQIAGSIREFGFTNPVLVDAENGIIAGHGRIMAAQKLGLEKVPCIRLDYLTESQKRAYIIADNKLALNAGWDFEMLKVEVMELQAEDFDVSLLGFEGDEIEKLTSHIEFAPGTEDDQGKLDEKSPIECPHCHKFFTP